MKGDSLRYDPDVPFSPPLSVQAKLSQVLSQTDALGKEAIEHEEGEENSFHGILNWNKMDQEVVAKYVPERTSG